MLPTLNLPLIVGDIIAVALAATRLAPFTKPYWVWAPKRVQAWFPSLVALAAGVVPAFSNVKTWMDFFQAVFAVGALPLALAAPGLSSPHNHPELPPPSGTDGTGIDEKIQAKIEAKLASTLPPPAPPPAEPEPPAQFLGREDSFFSLGLLVVAVAAFTVSAFLAASCAPQSDLAAPCDTLTLLQLQVECRAKVRADCARSDAGVDQTCPTFVACMKRVDDWHSCDAGAVNAGEGGAK